MFVSNGSNGESESEIDMSNDWVGLGCVGLWVRMRFIFWVHGSIFSGLALFLMPYQAWRSNINVD